MPRTATEVKALSLWRKLLQLVVRGANTVCHLHLDEGDAESKVGHVAEDERGREESANGNDVLEPAVPGHLHAVNAVEQTRRAEHDACSDGRKCQMPCCEEDGAVIASSVSRFMLLRGSLWERTRGS